MTVLPTSWGGPPRPPGAVLLATQGGSPTRPGLVLLRWFSSAED